MDIDSIGKQQGKLLAMENSETDIVLRDSSRSLKLFNWMIVPILVGSAVYVFCFSIGEIVGVLALIELQSAAYRRVVQEFHRVGTVLSVLSAFIHLGFVASKAKLPLLLVSIIACIALAVIGFAVNILWR